jgi:hypothetical protein
VLQVVPLTVKLLKTNLTQHVPSKETLHKLDMFCIALKSDSPIVSKVSARVCGAMAERHR